MGPVRSTFTCFANGYYADVDNNCQIFHVCYSAEHTDGTHEQHMYSFVCGNQTVRYLYIYIFLSYEYNWDGRKLMSLNIANRSICRNDVIDPKIFQHKFVKVSEIIVFKLCTYVAQW